MDEHDTASVDGEQRHYLLGRAATHRQLAARADTVAAQLTHRRFAGLYEERAAAIELVDQDQS